MKFSASFKVIVLVAVAGVSHCQNYQWSPCSRTCGQGTRHRRCRSTELPQCEAKYEDCTLKDCPDVTCTVPNVFKYDSPSECCKKEDRKSCGVVQIGSTSRRIIGGKFSKDGEWPWLAALWQKSPKKYICGGVLVNEKWVVTAAHCFEDNAYTAQEIMVILGMSKQVEQNPNRQTTDIEEYIKYPSYNGWNDDLALLKLKTSMRYSTYVHPICMPGSEEPDQDTICYVAGWGVARVIDIQAQRTSNKLRHVGLRVVPLEACKETYRNQASYIGVTTRTLCVGILSGDKDSCSGDSGSPLVCQRKSSCQWYFAGVVAFGVAACGAKNSPAVYTNVRVYEQWILNEITPDPCESSPCQNGGTCTKLGNDYDCVCNHLYTGKNCETHLFCPSNHRFRYRDSSSCCKISTEVCGVENPFTEITPAKIWPWLASILIRRSGTVSCVGALLSKDYVLTAAHCLDFYQPSDLIVMLGTSTIKVPASTHQKFEIGSTIVHENYDYPRNDVALIKLSKSAILNSVVKPICLPSLEKVKEGATCLVVGYEFPISVPRSAPDSTSEDFLSLYPLDVCTNSFKTINDPIWNKLNGNNHYCVGQFESTTSKYKCLPYLSGSPLICQRCSSCGWYLAGLSELGPQQCEKSPDVYTNVYNFEDWIRQQISLPRTSTFSCPI